MSVGTNHFKVGQSVVPSSGSGGTVITTLASWDPAPSGAIDGDWYEFEGHAYRFKASISWLVPAALYGYTYTQRGATLGDSATPTGWSFSAGTGSFTSTDGTVMTIDTYASAGNRDRLSIDTPPTAGARVWAAGWYWVERATGGSNTYSSGSIFHDDGTRRRLIGPNASSELSFANLAGTSARGESNETAQTSRAWVEYLAEPSGNAAILQAHADVPNALIDYSSNDTYGTPGFQVGDSATGSSSTTKFESFRVFELT